MKYLYDICKKNKCKYLHKQLHCNFPDERGMVFGPETEILQFLEVWKPRYYYTRETCLYYKDFHVIIDLMEL